MSKKKAVARDAGRSKGVVYPLAPTNKKARNRIPVDAKKGGFGVVAIRVPTKDLRKALKKAGRAKEFELVGWRKTGKVAFTVK